VVVRRRLTLRVRPRLDPADALVGAHVRGGVLARARLGRPLADERRVVLRVGRAGTLRHLDVGDDGRRRRERLLLADVADVDELHALLVRQVLDVGRRRLLCRLDGVGPGVLDVDLLGRSSVLAEQHGVVVSGLELAGVTVVEPPRVAAVDRLPGRVVGIPLAVTAVCFDGRRGGHAGVLADELPVAAASTLLVLPDREHDLLAALVALALVLGSLVLAAEYRAPESHTRGSDSRGKNPRQTPDRRWADTGRPDV